MQEVGRIEVSTESDSFHDWPIINQEHTTTHSYNSTNGSPQFVSVISVESSEPIEKPYVTVVSVDGESDYTEEVLVYRLPGERLGFGLKFDGGIRNADKVSRLFIQSCAGDSPASRTQASWGPLGPGDEILSIDGIRVDSMTRTDCVRALKESAVVIKLEVKRRNDASLPPPIPPRKCLRRRQSDSQVIQPVQQPEVPNKTRSCGVAQAEVYTDLFSTESTLPAESESDDTSSSLSTVVSRVSSTANSSFSDAKSINSVDLSPPTTVKSAAPFDLDKVLEPFLQLERELSSSTLDSGNLFTRLVEASTLLDSGTSSSSGVPDLPPRPVPRLSTTARGESPTTTVGTVATAGECPPPPPRTDLPRPRPPQTILHNNNNNNNNHHHHHHHHHLHHHQSSPPVPPPPPLPPPPIPQQHLPRLIDFVPKDRTDVLIPSPIHPPDKNLVEEITSNCTASNKLKEDASSSQMEKIPSVRMERGRSGWTTAVADNTALDNNTIDNGGVEQQLQLQQQQQQHAVITNNYELSTEDLTSNNNKEELQTAATVQPITTSTSNQPQYAIQRMRTRSGSCNDEKSERSVRDKIAMFSEQSAAISNNTTINHTYNNRKIVRPCKAPPSPPLKRFPSTVLATTSKLCEQYKPNSTSDLRTTCESNQLIHNSASQESTTSSTTLPRPEKTITTGLTRAVSFSGPTKLHSRSQSLVDIGSRASLKSDDSRRLSSMIEQRRRCMSKLRGLVIPEKVAEVPHFVDLPEIKSRDCPLPVPVGTSEKQEGEQSSVVDGLATSSVNSSELMLTSKSVTTPVIPTPPWKSSDANLPKYSPAFKRKSLSVYGIHNGNLSSWLGSSPTLADNPTGDQYLDLIPSRLSKQSMTNVSKDTPSPNEIKNNGNRRDEESDNDSAVSSSVSDLSHSPPNEVLRLSVTRTLSEETTTSGGESTITTASLNSEGTAQTPQPNLRNPLHTIPTDNFTTTSNNENIIQNDEISKNENPSFPDTIRPPRKSPDELLLNNNNDNKEKKLLNNNISDNSLTRISFAGCEMPPTSQFSSTDPTKIKSTGKHAIPTYKNNNYNCHNNNLTNNGVKKPFDKSDGQAKLGNNVQHLRVSSIDSTTSDDSLFPATSLYYGSVTNLQKEQQFGSITSLASSTSLISQQELSQLIEEANHTLEESHEVVVVILHRDNPGGSIGITLAGGADYEAKEITVHKVLVGSPAERDGRIQKGDRILSINGKSMKGLTHYESLAILKAPRPEVVLVVSRHKADNQEDTSPLRCHTNTIRSPRFIEPPKYANPPADKENEIKWGPLETVVLHKDGTGLGFSLEGGKDSPYGDMPLTIKKIFTGGCAEKCGLVCAGDELLSVNGVDVSGLSRIEAWALMKRLPDGRVTLAIRHPIPSTNP